MWRKVGKLELGSYRGDHGLTEPRRSILPNQEVMQVKVSGESESEDESDCGEHRVGNKSYGL